MELANEATRKSKVEIKRALIKWPIEAAVQQFVSYDGRDEGEGREEKRRG